MQARLAPQRSDLCRWDNKALSGQARYRRSFGLKAKRIRCGGANGDRFLPSPLSVTSVAEVPRQVTARLGKGGVSALETIPTPGLLPLTKDDVALLVAG